MHHVKVIVIFHSSLTYQYSTNSINSSSEKDSFFYQLLFPSLTLSFAHFILFKKWFLNNIILVSLSLFSLIFFGGQYSKKMIWIRIYKNNWFFVCLVPKSIPSLPFSSSVVVRLLFLQLHFTIFPHCVFLWNKKVFLFELPVVFD